jgi:hypothetical protein
MNSQKRRAIWLGFVGLLLIALGIKNLPVFLSLAKEHYRTNDKPVILFFSLDEPCECMAELTGRAEDQISNWPEERHAGIILTHNAMDQCKDLDVKYDIFRAPCLVLVDASDEVVWRQDYPLIEGEPFRLDGLEAAIVEIGSQ